MGDINEKIVSGYSKKLISRKYKQELVGKMVADSDVRSKAVNVHAETVGASAASLMPELSETQIEQIVADINRSGYGVVENFLSPQTVSSLQDFISTSVERGGNQYLGLIGKEAVQSTALEMLSDSPAFNRLMHRVYEFGMKKPAPSQSLYQVVRCLKGESGLVHSYYFHYDSYIVTALIPIHIPTSGQTGDLVMSLKRRPFRSSYVRNLVDKVLINNKFTQKMLKGFAISETHGFRKVKMIPGNIYFFWGYNTVHANEPCDINQIRATALFHFGDPYTNVGLRKITGRAQIRAEAAAEAAVEA